MNKIYQNLKRKSNLVTYKLVFKLIMFNKSIFYKVLFILFFKIYLGVIKIYKI